MYCKSYPNVILQLLLPAVSPYLFKDTVLVKEIEFGNDLVGIIPFRGISSPSSCGRRSFGSSWKNERWMWRLSVLRCSPAYQVVFSGLRPMDLKNGGRTLQSSFLASSGLSQFSTPYFSSKLITQSQMQELVDRSFSLSFFFYFTGIGPFALKTPLDFSRLSA